ncbi:MAG: MAPEG family protein [Alphaproteobacteria bacterium]|nr:MAPEG family protein [Alphaproteobacteria bacterium]
MQSPILAPAAILALWSMVVLIWVTVTRFAAIARLNKDQLRTLSKAGTRGPDLERVLPESVNWKSHNYTHLMEQPTVFYAAVVILALADAGGEVNTALAWSYTALRVLHSIWQATVNKLPVRMLLFTTSSLCLIALAINAARATL